MGFIGALVSVAAPIVKQVVPLVADKFLDMVSNHGKEPVSSAIHNCVGTSFGDQIKDLIANSPLPQFLKDMASEAVDDAVMNNELPTTPGAAEDVQAEFGDLLEELMRNLAAEMKEESEAAGAAEEGGEAGGGGGIKGKGKGDVGGGSGNWLTMLARAMSEVAGKHLANSIETAGKISDMKDLGDDASDSARANQAKEMTVLQASMQADTQMFKLAQEATTTIVKSVGEALSSTARKQ